MTGHVNVNGTWKNVAGMSANVNGTWKAISKAYTNVNGTWKEAFGSKTAFFVTYATGGSTPKLSEDGVNWTNLTSTPSLPYSGYNAVAMGNGKIVLSSSGNRLFAYSANNGQSWSQTSSFINTINGFDPDLFIFFSGKFIQLANTRSENAIIWSVDGANWNTVSNGYSGTLSNAYGRKELMVGPINGTLVIACSSTWDGATTNQYYTSTNGLYWTLRTSPMTNTYLDYRVCSGNDKFYFYATGGSYFTSYDGITWSQGSGVPLNSPYSAAAGNYKVLINNYSTTTYYRFNESSASGASWEQYSAPATIKRIRFFKDRFFAESTNGYIYTSSDGITWTATISIGQDPTIGYGEIA